MKAGGVAWLGAAAATMLAMACGGDDATSRRSPVRFQTGLSASETLDALSADENGRLCSDVQATELAFAHDSSVVEAACRVQGGTAAQLVSDPSAARAACWHAYEACLVDLPMKAAASSPCPNQDQTCAATVDDFGACLNAHLDFMAYYLGSMPDCDHRDPPNEPRKPADGSFDRTIKEMLAPCDAYYAKCPGPG